MPKILCDNNCPNKLAHVMMKITGEIKGSCSAHYFIYSALGYKEISDTENGLKIRKDEYGQI